MMTFICMLLMLGIDEWLGTLIGRWPLGWLRDGPRMQNNLLSKSKQGEKKAHNRAIAAVGSG